ncbi:hypothetical protein FVW17_RS26305, partial [Escherichia coli]
ANEKRKYEASTLKRELSKKDKRKRYRL